jgi:DNA-binding transcriptional LysR family regulator
MHLLECKLFVSRKETMALSTDMLEAFIKVAERLSVSAAANDLDLGKAVVSKRVAQLESRLKVTLFSRSTRKIALTPAGEAYLDFARRALREVDAAAERLRELRSELSGRIRVSATVSWGQRVLALHLAEFVRLHPAVELELNLSDRLVDLAVERTDLALRWTAAAAPPGLVVEPAATVRWRVVAAPGYLAQAGTPRKPSDLAAHECLSYWRETSDDTWVLADARGQRHTNQVGARFHANDVEAVTAAALAGLGLALLPDYLCEPALADGRLVQVLERWAPITRFGTQVTLLATPERLRIARIRALATFLQQRLQGAASAPRGR